MDPWPPTGACLPSDLRRNRCSQKQLLKNTIRGIYIRKNVHIETKWSPKQVLFHGQFLKKIFLRKCCQMFWSFQKVVILNGGKNWWHCGNKGIIMLRQRHQGSLTETHKHDKTTCVWHDNHITRHCCIMWVTQNTQFGRFYADSLDICYTESVLVSCCSRFLDLCLWWNN